jgi:hypothetical protein
MKEAFSKIIEGIKKYPVLWKVVKVMPYLIASIVLTLIVRLLTPLNLDESTTQLLQALINILLVAAYTQAGVKKQKQ